MATDCTLVPIAIGKIPGEREFLPTDAVDLDEWLTVGFEDAVEREGIQWRERFAEATPARLLWAGNSRRPSLYGLIAPSWDAIGRPYPLAVLAPLPGVPRERSYLAPLACEAFLGRALEAIRHAQRTAMSGVEFASRMSAERPPNASDFDAAVKSYDSWRSAAPAVETWGRLFLEDAPRATRALQCMSQGRAGEVRRLALGRGDPLAATMWLDVLSRMRSVPRAAFWRTPGAELIVSVDAPPVALVAELLVPKESQDHGPPNVSERLETSRAGLSMEDYLCALLPQPSLRSWWTRAWSRRAS